MKSFHLFHLLIFESLFVVISSTEKGKVEFPLRRNLKFLLLRMAIIP